MMNDEVKQDDFKPFDRDEVFNHPLFFLKWLKWGID